MSALSWNNSDILFPKKSFLFFCFFVSFLNSINLAHSATFKNQENHCFGQILQFLKQKKAHKAMIKKISLIVLGKEKFIQVSLDCIMQKQKKVTEKEEGGQTPSLVQYTLYILTVDNYPTFCLSLEKIGYCNKQETFLIHQQLLSRET